MNFRKTKQQWIRILFMFAKILQEILISYPTREIKVANLILLSFDGLCFTLTIVTLIKKVPKHEYLVILQGLTQIILLIPVAAFRQHSSEIVPDLIFIIAVTMHYTQSLLIKRNKIILLIVANLGILIIAFIMIYMKFWIIGIPSFTIMLIINNNYYPQRDISMQQIQIYDFQPLQRQLHFEQKKVFKALNSSFQSQVSMDQRQVKGQQVNNSEDYVFKQNSMLSEMCNNKVFEQTQVAQDWHNRLELFPVGVMIIHYDATIEFINTHIRQMLQDNESNDYYSDDDDVIDDERTIRILMKEIEFKLIPNLCTEKQRSPLRHESYIHGQSLSQQRFIQIDPLSSRYSLEKIITLLRENSLNKIMNLQNSTLEIQGQYKKRGENILIAGTLYRIANQDGQYSLILFLNDITKQQQLLNQEIKQKFKNKIINSFSHELKTPLNAAFNYILAATEINSIPVQVNETCLKPAINSLKILSSMINDIIDFNHINENLFELDYKQIEIYDLIQEVNSIFQKLCFDKGLKFQTEIKFKKQILVDPQRLMQILINMTQNALKFSFKGQITLKVENDRDEYIIVSVSDEGQGMSQSQVIRIQEALENYIKDQIFQEYNDWTGFGLIISQMILKQISGREKINIFSHGKDQGTCVSFCLKTTEITNINSLDPIDQFPSIKFLEESPRIEILTKRSAATEENYNIIGSDADECLLQNKVPEMKDNKFIQQLVPSVPLKCQCRRILSVDDEVFNQNSLKMLLSKFNIEVDQCYTGNQAIEQLLSRKLKICGKLCTYYQVILMDYQMPIMDGCQVTKQIREYMKRRQILQIPIIGLTAFTSKDDKYKCLQAGMNYVLHKPLRINDFKNCLQALGCKFF